MMYHTLKHGVDPEEFSRVIEIAMSKNADILLVSLNSTKVINDRLDEMLGRGFAKRLFEEHEVEVVVPGARPKTFHLASISSCTAFKKGSVVLPWVALSTVHKAMEKFPTSDIFFIANNGPGDAQRQRGIDELTQYLSGHRASKAV